MLTKLVKLTWLTLADLNMMIGNFCQLYAWDRRNVERVY